MPAFTPNPKPVTEQTPREIDEQLAHWDFELYAAAHDLQSRQRYAADALTRRGATKESVEAQYGEGIRKATARLAACHAAIAPFNAEFTRRGGWKRYFLVVKGHVHRERTCHTCRYDTLYNWLTDLSDCNEDAMVTKHGDLACAECFPQVLKHPAFIASAKLRREQEDAKRNAQCDMSGRSVDKAHRTPSGRRAKCPNCGLVVPVTKYGLFRQHNPPAPKVVMVKCNGSGSMLKNEAGQALDGRFMRCLYCNQEFSTNKRGAIPVHKVDASIPVPDTLTLLRQRKT